MAQEWSTSACVCMRGVVEEIDEQYAAVGEEDNDAHLLFSDEQMTIN